ncbi:Uncharacterised protein [Mycobacterium tuberculosis]|nr:Uncharacterised protein [Mycobacterium tuberculosis]
MAEDDHVATGSFRMWANENRAVLPSLPDRLDQFVEFLLVLFKAITDKGSVDNLRIKFNNCFALKELVGARRDFTD